MGGVLEIHKPKPVHTWREFLVEIGTIICGILIALGLEQIVEQAHWGEKVREAKTSIHKELALAAVFGEERRAQRDCIDAYLAGLAAAIVASPAQWSPQPTKFCGLPHNAVYTGDWRPWPTEVWHTIEAEGTVSHFKANYRLQAPFVFNYIREIGDLSREERDLGTQLQPLSYPLILTPDGKLSLLKTIQALRAMNDRLTLYSTQMGSQVSALGETPTEAELREWRAKVPDLFVRPGEERNVTPTHAGPSD